MGDLRNAAKREAEKQAAIDRERRRREGWTIFHFDFNPKLTRRDLSPGGALRYLLKITTTKLPCGGARSEAMPSSIKSCPPLAKPGIREKNTG